MRLGFSTCLKSRPPPPLAPFYLSTQEYLDLRQDKPKNKTNEIWPQTILHYDVRNVPVLGVNLTSNLDRVQKITIALGEDFAAMTIENKLKIYDFKFNRLLIVKSQNTDGSNPGPLVFDNISLFAKAYRNMNTVKQVTRNGRLKTLPIAEGVSLDAFWIESSMSWAASAPETKLVFKTEQQALSVKRKNDVVFKAKFSKEKYKSDRLRDALLAFAHHEWPLHPQILQALYEFDAPPKQLEILMYGPNALKGQKQTWVLTEQVHKKAVFPLPENALAVLQQPDVTPLAYVISAAAHNQALGGIDSLEELERRFKREIEADDIWQAWLTGQRYAAYTGRCDTVRGSAICQSLADIEAAHMSEQPEYIQDYFTALRASKRPRLESRLKSGRKAELNAETIKLLQPYLDKKTTPAFVLRIAAMARAKMKAAQVKAQGLTNIDAEDLLMTALVKDPYDPKTYVGLAQVLAARGAYEQSWDIYDALRAAIPTTHGVELKINRVEQNLRKSTPGYFLDQ